MKLSMSPYGCKTLHLNKKVFDQKNELSNKACHPWISVLSIDIKFI